MEGASDEAQARGTLHAEFYTSGVLYVTMIKVWLNLGSSFLWCAYLGCRIYLNDGFCLLNLGN